VDLLIPRKSKTPIITVRDGADTRNSGKLISRGKMEVPPCGGGVIEWYRVYTGALGHHSPPTHLLLGVDMI